MKFPDENFFIKSLSNCVLKLAYDSDVWSSQELCPEALDRCERLRVTTMYQKFSISSISGLK